MAPSIPPAHNDGERVSPRFLGGFGGQGTRGAPRRQLRRLARLASTSGEAQYHRRRRRTGTGAMRQPPGIGVISILVPGMKSAAGSARNRSSIVGMSRSSRRRGVGGTGGGEGGLAEGILLRTAARTGSPAETSVPHVAQVRPPWFTPSQTRQRQMVTAAPRPWCVSATYRRGGWALPAVSRSSCRVQRPGPCRAARWVRPSTRVPPLRQGEGP